MSQSSSLQKTLRPIGCCFLGCLGMIVGVPIILGIAGYGVLFHTSIPLKLLVSVLNTGESHIELNGMSGSASSGFAVKEVVIKGKADGHEERIEGLTFRYNGFLDIVRNKRVIIDEISVARADLLISPDFLQKSDDSGKTDDEKIEVEPETDPQPDSPTRIEQPFVFELKTVNLQNLRIRSTDDRFEWEIPQIQLEGMSFKKLAFSIEELNLKDLKLQTSDAESDVSIPQIRLAGLQIQGNNFELAEFVVNSNLISLELKDAGVRRIQNQLIPYSRQLRGVVSPNVHDFIRQEFDVSAEFAAVEGRVLSRLTGFGEAVELVNFSDGSTFLNVKSFSPGMYFNFKSGLVPERCSLVGSSGNPEPSKCECFLGPTRFTIAPEELAQTDTDKDLKVRAQVGELQITARLQDSDGKWPPTVEFSSMPPLPLPDILSQIYFQTNYAKLKGQQRSRIDALVTELEQLTDS